MIKLLFAYKNLNTLRLVVDEKLLRIAAELGLPDGAVLLSPDIVVPISIGFFRPKIYLPIMNLTDAEFRIVLRHERQHICERRLLGQALLYGTCSRSVVESSGTHIS